MHANATRNKAHTRPISVALGWDVVITSNPSYLCVTYRVSLMERDHKCFSFILFETKLSFFHIAIIQGLLSHIGVMICEIVVFTLI